MHHPFCSVKCPFCAFPSSYDVRLEDDYIEALGAEIDRFSTLRQVQSIYFGGGSPSRIPLKTLASFVAKLKRFATNDAEITIELRPEDCVGNFADNYVGIGFNRLSIGVQSLSADKLLRLQRSRLLNGFRVPANIKVSFDVIIGTIFDDINLADELMSVCDLAPHHISIYPLSLEEGSLFYSNPPDFLSYNNLGNQYTLSEQLLTSRGYFKYESSNYSIDEHSRCNHNMGYWLNEDFIGLGVAANSKIKNTSVERLYNVDNYIKSARTNHNFESISRTLTDTEFALETLLMGLRLSDGVCLGNVMSKTPDSKGLKAELIRLQYDNFITISDDKIFPIQPLNFGKLLESLGWISNCSNGWRKIMPGRYSSSSP